MKKSILSLTALLAFMASNGQTIYDPAAEAALITQLAADTATKSRQLDEIQVTTYKSVNEKVVTIGKAPIKPMDLPQSVANINKEVLEQQQVTQLSDAVKNFNGVYVMGTTGGYQEELAGRGFAYTSSNTFKNGIRFNNTAMPEMSSLERVEVMKGSSAILYGNVAAGGVINLVTRKPLFEKGGEVSMRVGSYDFYKPSLDVYGAINNSKVAAFRINTVYQKAGSFRDVVNSERMYINPSLLFKLGKKTELLLEGDYLNDERTPDFGVGAINYELIDVPRNRFLGVTWSNYLAQQQSASATITHSLSDNWQLRNVTSYQKFSSDLFTNQRPNGNSQFVKTNGDWIRGLQRTKVNEDYYVTQVDMTGKFNTGSVKHTLLVGADADKYITRNTAFNAVAKYDSINVFNPDKYKVRNDIPDLSRRTLTSSPMKRVGVYAQDLVSIIEQVKVLAGLRYSYLESTTDVYTFSTEKSVVANQFDRAFSPRLGLVLQPLQTISIFGSYSTSFSPNTGVDVEGNPLPVSYIEQYEAGVKKDFFRGLLSVNVTAYQIKNSNLAQTSLENGNTNSNIKELTGEITSKGVEVDVMSKEWKGASIIAGYSYNDTRYTRSNTFIVGSKLRYNPEHTANASVYYNFGEVGVKPLSHFNAGFGALYIGKRYGGRSTRLTVENDSFKLIPIPAYVNLEASVGYALQNLSLRLKMTNLLDTLNYNVHDDNSINPVAPRQVMGTVAYKF